MPEPEVVMVLWRLDRREKSLTRYLHVRGSRIKLGSVKNIAPKNSSRRRWQADYYATGFVGFASNIHAARLLVETEYTRHTGNQIDHALKPLEEDVG